MKNIILKEFCVIIPTLLFCYIAHKLDCYNVMIIYLLVRLYVEDILRGEENESY